MNWKRAAKRYRLDALVYREALQRANRAYFELAQATRHLVEGIDEAAKQFEAEIR